MTAPLRHPTAPAHFTAHRHEGLIVSADEVAPHSRDLAEETPVAMVFDGSSAAVMMASPSDIEDFAFGFARTEGFITGFDDVREFEQVAHDSGIEARFWLREDRFTATLDIDLQDAQGHARTFTLHPLPHPSPLNQTWFKRFPALLEARLRQLDASR